jgi:hypothetical protein
MYSNCFATPREDPSPTSSSFNFSALVDHLVVGFLGGIVPATQNKILEIVLRNKTRKNIYMNCNHIKSTNLDTYL